MRKIKSYKHFFEDATSTASSTAGSGDISNPTVSSIPGIPASSGTGDISFYLRSKRRKKGKPNQVTDLRDLAPAEGITKVEDIEESYRLTDEENQNIDQCLTELYHQYFQLTELKYIDEDESVEVEVDGLIDDFFQKEIIISLHKTQKMNWRGNISLRKNFDKNNFDQLKVSTLRHTKELDKEEENLLEIAEEACLHLINYLDYQSGTLTISWTVAGSAMPWNSERDVNINIGINLVKKEKNR